MGTEIEQDAGKLVGVSRVFIGSFATITPFTLDLILDKEEKWNWILSENSLPIAEGRGLSTFAEADKVGSEIFNEKTASFKPPYYALREVKKWSAYIPKEFDGLIIIRLPNS